MMPPPPILERKWSITASLKLGVLSPCIQWGDPDFAKYNGETVSLPSDGSDDVDIFLGAARGHLLGSGWCR